MSNKNYTRHTLLEEENQQLSLKFYLEYVTGVEVFQNRADTNYTNTIFGEYEI
ncbi:MULTISPECIES: hypothetical protein [Clostridium]|uniref:hypothetical protein n=1 Tax=Clostridium TaxID=1485 RepID=UPI000A431248|nr:MULTISPECIES: hypothetical protein [Clostridium]